MPFCNSNEASGSSPCPVKRRHGSPMESERHTTSSHLHTFRHLLCVSAFDVLCVNVHTQRYKYSQSLPHTRNERHKRVMFSCVFLFRSQERKKEGQGTIPPSTRLSHPVPPQQPRCWTPAAAPHAGISTSTAIEPPFHPFTFPPTQAGVATCWGMICETRVGRTPRTFPEVPAARTPRSGAAGAEMLPLGNQMALAQDRATRA